MSINKVILTGYLGTDPKSNEGATPVAKFRMATEDMGKTEWHSVVCFNKQAENVLKYLTKGSYAEVEGRISYDSWEGKDGQKKYKTEILAHRVGFGPKTSSAPPKDAEDDIPF